MIKIKIAIYIWVGFIKIADSYMMFAILTYVYKNAIFKVEKWIFRL